MISCDLEGVSKSSSWPSLIGISLLLPLLLTLVLSQQKKERREIRVGKAMVRRSKAMKPLTINPETREGKVLRVLPSGR